MAKSTVNAAEAFDGATYESYEDDKSWWDEDGARNFLAADKPVVVVHYDNTNCDATYAEYQAIYGRKPSCICEDRALKAYRYFNERNQTRYGGPPLVMER